MELRWTEEAVTDLERITHYLFEKTPAHAPELVRTIYNAPTALLSFPYRGRLGKKQGTRELVLAPPPYLMVCRISGDVIHIARILHGAQKWPETTIAPRARRTDSSQFLRVAHAAIRGLARGAYPKAYLQKERQRRTVLVPLL